MLDRPIRHLLLDADGVVQDLPGGWEQAVAPYAGEAASAFLEEVWAAERPLLTGPGDFLALLERSVEQHGLSCSAAEVQAAVWHRIVASSEVLALVAALRRAGYGVHLATNQAGHRAERMRSHLGYDHLFDVSCYSCELGVAKPDPAFFLAAAQRVGADPARILFVDDSESNVRAARKTGMAAEQWHSREGLDVLLARLSRHGVIRPES